MINIGNIYHKCLITKCLNNEKLPQVSFNMVYAKILSQLDYNEKAIFLVIGDDHIAIIRQMFQENPYFEVVETEKWLGKTKIRLDQNYR